MPSCAVPGCNSRSRRNLNDWKTHCFFNVGKDKDRQKEWQKSIGRDLTEKHCVCEKHFHPSEIITKRVLRGPDGIVYSEIPYKIPRLERGAVPVRELENDSVPDQLQDHNYTRKNVIHQNLFQVPAQDSRPVQNMHEQNVKMETSTCDSNILVENHVTANHQNKKSDEKTELQTDENVSPENENCANQKQTFSFDDLRSNLSSIKIPMAWVKNDIKNDIDGAFIYFAHPIVRSCENTLKMVFLKELIVQSDLQFVVNVMGKPINFKAIGIDTDKITDIETLEQTLHLLELHNVCKGCVTDLNVNSSITTRDCANILRHKKCPLLLASGSMCTNCRYVVKMLNRKINQEKENQTKKKLSGCQKHE